MEFTLYNEFGVGILVTEKKVWRVELEHTGNFHDKESGLIKRFGEWFSDEEMTDVYGLIIVTKYSAPKDEKVFKLLGDLSKFKKLRFLGIPYDAVPFVDMNSVAIQLNYLALNCCRSLDSYEYWKDGNHPMMFEQVLPNLKQLKTYFPPVYFQNFDIDNYPSLEWVDFELEDFDKTGKSIKLFNQHPKIKGFKIDSIKNKDLLKAIRSDIKGLCLWSLAPKKFDFSYLQGFSELKYLKIAASNSEFDCNFLRDLPELVELDLTQIKGLKSVNTILEMGNLQKIRLHSEFKTDLSDDFKKAMLKKFEGISILRIGI